MIASVIENPHHHIYNDPLNRTDPMGLRPGDGSINYGDIGAACDGAGGKIIRWGDDGTRACLEPPLSRSDGDSCWPPNSPGGSPIVLHDGYCAIQTTEITCARGPSFLDPICRNSDTIITGLLFVTAAALTVASAGAFAYAAVTIGGGSGFLLAPASGGAAVLMTGGGVAVSPAVAQAVGVGAVSGLGAIRATDIANQQRGSTPGGDSRSVAEVLSGKKGSIKQAKLPAGSPSWDSILNMTMAEVRAAASANRPGFKPIPKLLNDSRFNR